MIETIQLVTSFLVLGGMIFAIYSYFRNPDINAKQRLDLIDQRCSLKHEGLDNAILISKNHLEHLEKSFNEMEKTIVQIETILDERLPPKKQL